VADARALPSPARPIGPLKEATQSFIGRNALFALEGEEWRLHRSVLRAVLTPEVVSAHMAAHFEAVSFRLASKLGDYAKAAPIVDMHEVFCRYHVASVTSAFLENDLGFFHGGLLGGKEHAEICSAFEFLLRELPQQTSSVFTQEWREQARQARAEIEALIRGRGGAPPVLELLEAQYAGAPGRDALVDSLVGDVLQLCFAGYNTECVTLSFTLFYLAQHPLWLAEVQREVDAQLRTHDFARGAALDVEGLRVLRACFCEALRLVPPTIFTARRTGEPMTFAGDGAAGGGFALPPGTDVFVPIVFTGQDPAVWGEDWDRFNPGRWLAAPEAGARGPPGAFIPFGAGPRACLGEGFAHAASATCLAVLLYFFSFEVPPGARQEPRWTGYGVRPFDAGLGRVAMSLRVVKRNRPRRSGAVVVAAAGGRKLGG
jgi:cytochrome P450